MQVTLTDMTGGCWACRDRQDGASQRKAVELYKELQGIMQEKYGSENDSNAMLLRTLSDTLGKLQQYGKTPCMLDHFPQCAPLPSSQPPQGVGDASVDLAKQADRHTSNSKAKAKERQTKEPQVRGS